MTSKSWFFRKLHRTDQPLARLFKKKRVQKYTKSKMKSWLVPTNTRENQRTVREFCEKLYSNTLDNLEEIGKFQEI